MSPLASEFGRWYNTTEAAQIARVKRVTIVKFITEGKLIAEKHSDRWWISEPELAAWLLIRQRPGRPHKAA
jgi:predicted site-specific integrase-resolvase